MPRATYGRHAHESDDPKLGIVDRHCRAHGIPDLFVAGQSDVPSAGPKNAVLTIMTFARRLADRLERFDASR